MPHTKLIEQRLRFLKLDEGDNFQTLREVKALVEAGIDEMLDDFYDHILKQPELKALFRGKESLKNARNAQKSHWMGIIFARNLGKKQFDQMKQVGETHVKVGLGPSWYLSAYCFMLNEFIDRIVEHHQGDTEKMTRVVQELNKAIVLDVSFVIESYIEAKNATMREVLIRATRFTEDVTKLTEDLNRTADALKTKAESLAESSADRSEAQEVIECSGRLSSQVKQLNERLDQLMYGDKLKIVSGRNVSFLTRVKRFIDKW